MTRSVPCPAPSLDFYKRPCREPPPPDPRSTFGRAEFAEQQTGTIKQGRRFKPSDVGASAIGGTGKDISMVTQTWCDRMD